MLHILLSMQSCFMYYNIIGLLFSWFYAKAWSYYYQCIENDVCKDNLIVFLSIYLLSTYVGFINLYVFIRILSIIAYNGYVWNNSLSNAQCTNISIRWTLVVRVITINILSSLLCVMYEFFSSNTLIFHYVGLSKCFNKYL